MFHPEGEVGELHANQPQLTALPPDWADYQQCLDYLNSLGNELRGARYELETIRQLMPEVCPGLCHPAVLIAGTNGKGSAAWWLSRILQNAGYRVALYTSPHLDTIRERIRLDGELIGEEDFLCHARRTAAAIRRLAGELERLPTYYEWVTLIGASYFQEAAPDIHVCEIGLGGRLDALNVFQPVLSVITTVDRDHENFLGTTLEQIAREKMGILRPAAPVVLGPQDDWSRPLRTEIECGAARVVRAREIYERSLAGESPDIEFGSGLGLAGDFQRYNAATVWAACRELQRLGWNLPEGAIRRGLAAGLWPARMEVVSREPEIIIDGAHNPQAVAELVRYLRRNQAAPVIVFGAMRDKEYPAMIFELLPVSYQIILTQVPGDRSAGLPDFRNLLQATQMEYRPQIPEALRLALDLSAGQRPIYVVGSLYLAAEARRFFTREVSA
jgi:dihydrofolate synthase/folylpolyglutamate synthase